MSANDTIERVLAEVRPALNSDGGDVEFVEYDAAEGVVHLRLTGVCESCPISIVTLKQGIERRMVDALPQVREVRTVSI